MLILIATLCERYCSITILQIRKPRPRALKSLAPSHTALRATCQLACKWQIWLLQVFANANAGKQVIHISIAIYYPLAALRIIHFINLFSRIHHVDWYLKIIVVVNVCMLKMVSWTSCFVIFTFRHVLLQISSLFPLSIPHFSMEGTVVLIQMKELLRDNFTIQLFNLFLKKIAQKRAN